MIGVRKSRSWKALALLAAIFALILLLLPQAANHHAAVLFLFVPIFLFSLIDSLAHQRPAADKTTTLPHQSPTRPTLFQRPPPRLA